MLSVSAQEGSPDMFVKAEPTDHRTGNENMIDCGPVRNIGDAALLVQAKGGRGNGEGDSFREI